MGRFVLLFHDSPAPHLDLMLERGDRLATWRLPDSLQEWRNGKVVEAISLAEHRLAYLDYEGPVSDNRGSVQRKDSGLYTLIEWKEDALVAILKGERLRGRLTLRRSAGGKAAWTATFEAQRTP